MTLGRNYPVIRNPKLVADDLLLRFGTDSDGVILNRSTALAADTALTNVLIGTPVSEALAANSLIISNVTAAGDIALYGNRGGNSEQFLFYDTSAGVLYEMANFGGIMLGLAADPPAPDNAAVHIWNGSAGTIAAGSGAFLVLENSAAFRIQFLTPNTATNSGLLFGDPESNVAAYFVYNHVSTRFEVGVEAADRLYYSAAAFAFQEATTISSTSAGQLIFSGGLMIGVNAAANQIDDASNGAGSTTTYIGNASINVTSDERVKTNIRAYQGDALGLLTSLPVKQFAYSDLAPMGGYEGEYVGFTAQDMLKIAPWAVNTQGDTGNPWQARYEFLNGLMVKAIQQLESRLSALGV